MSVKLIPCFCSTDLPQEVEEELQAFESTYCLSLCFHGDDGCVFTLWDEDYASKVPLFLNWLASLKMVTLPLDFYDLKEYLTITNTLSLQFANEVEQDQWRAKYKVWCEEQESKGRRKYFQFAMTGS